jgi:hypothetical protein
MLNLPIAMLTRRRLAIILFFCFFLLGAQATPQDQPQINAPVPGSALQGTITIQGTTGLPEFQYAEVAFSYSENQPESWFLIQQSREPVKDGILAAWDTTTIADGDYRLRLQVYLTNGRVMTTEIAGLRVRNYTPVETNTPAPTSQSDTPVVVDTSTPILPTTTPLFTPTAFPPNPAQVHPSDLTGSVTAGIGAAVVIFAILALYESAHNRGRS